MTDYANDVEHMQPHELPSEYPEKVGLLDDEMAREALLLVLRCGYSTEEVVKALRLLVEDGKW